MNHSSRTNPPLSNGTVSNGNNNHIINETVKKQLCRIIDEEAPRDGEIDFPIYLADLKKLRYEYALWRTHLPRVQVFYAVKCCTETPVLKELMDLNSSFDCASQREMEIILKLGADPSRIIFANTIKSVSGIKYAAEQEVSLMTFDNEFELYKIKKHYPHAKLIIRLECKKTQHTALAFGMKFGCPMKKIEKLLCIAKSERLNVVGVSFHVGCNTDNGEPYAQSIQDAHKVFQLGKEAGFNFDILDIGGGFAGYYGPGVTFEKTAARVNLTLDEYFPLEGGVSIIAEPGTRLATSTFTLAVKTAARVNLTLEEYFPPERGVRIIAEPGTRLVTSTFTLAVKVIGKASNEGLEEGHVMSNGELVPVKARFLYYVNEGTFGSLTLNIAEIPKMKVLRHKGQEESETYPSVVFGPTCDPTDVIYSTIMLPELDIGDWLYLENCGAYSLSSASDFNMIDKVRCFYVEDN